MILKNTSRLLFIFILVFGIYTSLNGHRGIGGGFAGGVMIALGYILMALSAGGQTKPNVTTGLAGLGGLVYIGIASAGLAGGFFFFNIFFKSRTLADILPAGTIQLESAAAAFMTAVIIIAAFRALSAFRPQEEHKQ